MCPELVERPLRLIGFTCSRLDECGAVLAGVKAKPSGWPFDRLRASLDPSSGRRNLRQCREQEGEWV